MPRAVKPAICGSQTIGGMYAGADHAEGRPGQCLCLTSTSWSIGPAEHGAGWPFRYDLDSAGSENCRHSTERAFSLHGVL
jgi:hypothetical protein